MTVVEMIGILESAGLQSVHNNWKHTKDSPYGVVVTPYSNNFYADGKVYFSVQHYQLELYADRKTASEEAALEAALLENGIPFEKTEQWIDEEKIYQVTYDCEV